jgi:hypothetical protein
MRLQRLARCPDGARSHAVDPASLCSELLGERLDIIHRRRFCLRVVVKIRGWIVGLFRSRADDDGAGLGVWQRRLNDPEWGIDVGLHRRIEILGRNVEDRIVRLLATGVAHKNVQTTKAFNSSCNEFLAEFLVPQVAGYGYANAARGLDQIDHFLRVRLFGRKIVDGDVGTLARVSYRRRPTHAGIATGDQSLAAEQAA